MKNIHFKKTNTKNLKKFLSICKEELKTFRYFNKRSISIIKTHVLNNIIAIDDLPIGYFHLEKENNIFWFGVCISKKYQSNKLGSLILSYVISFCLFNNIKKINLTVDAHNTKAIHLYIKYKFKIKKINGGMIHMILEL
jgi:RimJ/RimL family protein N-acetyltransferase